MKDLIDELFDVDAIKKQIDGVNGMLKDLQGSMQAFGKAIKSSVADFDTLNISEVQKKNAEQSEKLTGMLKLEADAKKKIAEETAKLAFAQSEEGKAILQQLSQIKELTKEEAALSTITQKEAKDIENLHKALTNQAKSIAEAQKANIALRKQVKELDVTTEEGRATVDKYNKVIDVNNKFINENSDKLTKQKINVGNYKSAIEGLIAGTSTEREVMRQLSQELAHLQLVTENGTKGTEEQIKGYNDITVQMGKMKDTISDARNAVKGAEDDYAGLSLVLESFEGLSTGLSMVQSTTALLGVENDRLTIAIQKQQAAHQLMNAIQKVGNMLRDKEIVLGQLQALTESKNTQVKFIATKAQLALNAAMSMNPIMIVVIALAALTAGVIAFTHWIGDATEETEAVGDAFAKAAEEAQAFKKSMGDLNTEYALLKTAGADEATMLQKANAILQQYGGTALISTKQFETFRGELEKVDELHGKGHKAYVQLNEDLGAAQKELAGLTDKKERNVKLTGDEKDKMKELTRVVENLTARLSQQKHEHEQYVKGIVGVNNKIKEVVESEKAADEEDKKAAEKKKQRHAAWASARKKALEDEKKAAEEAAKEAFNLEEATDKHFIESQRKYYKENIKDKEELEIALAELDIEAKKLEIVRIDTHNKELMKAREKQNAELGKAGKPVIDKTSDEVKNETDIMKLRQEMREIQDGLDEKQRKKQEDSEKEHAENLKKLGEQQFTQRKIEIEQNITDETERAKAIEALEKGITDYELNELEKRSRDEKLKMSERVDAATAYANKELEIEQKKNEKIREQRKILTDALKEYGKQALDAALDMMEENLEVDTEAFEERMDMIDAETERRQQAFEEQQTVLDDELAAAKQRIEYTIYDDAEKLRRLEEQDKNHRDKVAALDAQKKAADDKAQADKKKEQLQMWKAQQEAAKSQAYIDFGRAAMSAVTSGLAVPFPASVIAIASLLALAGVGLSQALSNINSQKPPQYEKGTTFHPGGAQIVSEHGQIEVSETPTGKTIVTAQPTLLNLSRGSKVYPTPEKYYQQKGGKVRAELADDRIVDAIRQSKAEQHVSLDSRGIWSITNKRAQKQRYISSLIKL